MTKLQAYSMLVVLISILGMTREYLKGRTKVTYHKPKDLGMQSLIAYIRRKS